MIVHKPSKTFMISIPGWHSYEPGYTYRSSNLKIMNHFSSKTWAGNSRYVSYNELQSSPLTPKEAQKLKTYKHLTKCKNIINKYKEYAYLYKKYPRLDENKWYKTSPTQSTLDVKIASELSIIEVSVEYDTDDVVEFVNGVSKIEQFSKGKANYICWSCGMKMKKLPGFLIRKPTGTGRMFLCPICATGIAEASQPMIESMGTDFVEKVKKQLFIKKLTEL